MKSVHTWLPQDAPGARGGNGTMRSISGGGMDAPGARGGTGTMRSISGGGMGAPGTRGEGLR